MRRVAGLGASLLLLFQVRTATGEDASLRSEPSQAVALNWTAPESCPDSQSILSRVAGLVGRAVTASPNAPFSVQARVIRDSVHPWTLEMSWNEGATPTSRTVAAATCDELADAAALFIALAIDPNLPAANRGPSAAAEANEQKVLASEDANTAPSAPPRSARETRAVAGSKPEAAPQPPLRVHVGALGAIWFERLPSAAPGLSLITGVSRRRWCASVELAFFPQQHTEVTSAQTGGDLWLASAELNLAYSVTENRLRLAPYVALEFDLMHGAGTGQLRPAQGSTVFAAFGVGARLDYSVSRAWALQVRGKGSAPLSRPSFYAGDIEVFRPGWLGVEVGLGAAVTFQ